MKKILFLNQYNDQAPKIFRYALKIAQYMEATVLLTHVFEVEEPPLFHDRIEEYEIEKATFQSIIRNQENRELERLEEFASDNMAKQYAAIPLEFEARGGLPREEILSIAKEQNIDLLVMGTKSPNSFWEAISGELAPQMIDQADCPVLLIPPAATFMGLSKIVYATDFLNPDEETVNTLLHWTKLFKSELQIIHFENEESKRQEAVLKMEDILGEHSKEKVELKILQGNIKTGILDYLEASECKIIAMATHRRGFWEHLLDPSMTKQIASETNIPVLVFKKN